MVMDPHLIQHHTQVLKPFQNHLYQGRTSGCACILACIHGAAYVELPKLPNDIDG